MDEKLNSRYAIRVTDERYNQFINLSFLKRRRINEKVREIWESEVRETIRPESIHPLTDPVSCETSLKASAWLQSSVSPLP